MRWSEGKVHVAMRYIFRNHDWQLIAGEYPGGTDHELYALNVVDPTVARDSSPDPRRHSLGELIPDLVAFKNDYLAIVEAKVKYNEGDRLKLSTLLTERKSDLYLALIKFANERKFPQLLPVEKLIISPVLAFVSDKNTPTLPDGFSYLKIIDYNNGVFEGPLQSI